MFDLDLLKESQSFLEKSGFYELINFLIFDCGYKIQIAPLLASLIVVVLYITLNNPTTFRLSETVDNKFKK